MEDAAGRRLMLSPRQRLFVHEYLLSGDIKAAIKICGYDYKPHEAIRVLEKPHIKAYLDMMRDKMDDQAAITRAWKLSKLKRCAEVSMPDKDVDALSDREYELVNSNAAVQAISEMNKMQGDLAPVKMENTSTTLIDVPGIRDIIDDKQKDC